MAHIWANIQAFDKVSRFVLFEPAANTMQRLTLSTASIFVNESLFIYIFSVI